MIVIIRALVSTVLCIGLGGMSVAAQPVCKPTLVLQRESFAPVSHQRRVWSARVDADAAGCATVSGLFSIRFIRASETAPDIAFAEPFIWSAGARSVAVIFGADEAVQSAWIDDVGSCPCRRD